MGKLRPWVLNISWSLVALAALCGCAVTRPAAFPVQSGGNQGLLYPQLQPAPVMVPAAGAAAAALGKTWLCPELTAFVLHWQRQTRKLVRNHSLELRQAGFGDPDLGLARRPELGFDEPSFRTSMQYLHDALQTSPQPDTALQQLLIGHDYCRMLIRQLQAAAAVEDDPDALAALAERAVLLQQFRTQYQQLLQQPPARLLIGDTPLADLLAIQWPLLFADATPLGALPVLWFFKPDPDNLGLQQAWPDTDFQALTHNWQFMRIDRPWTTSQDSQNGPLAEAMPDYRGVAWYGMDLELTADDLANDIFLALGPVFANCQVFVNGVAAATCQATALDPAVFRVQLNEYAQQHSPLQLVLIRVEDHSGRGGFCGPAWLSSRARPSPEPAAAAE